MDLLGIFYPIGRLRVLPQTLGDIEEEVRVGLVDTPVAAAASTLIYQLAYGDDDRSCGSNNREEEGTEKEQGKNEDLNLSSDSEFSVPGGLLFLNDDDVIVIDPDSDDELFSSFPKDKACHKNLIPGGP